MFLRLEVSPKSEFSDPFAKSLVSRFARVHSDIAEKIRWMRVLDVYWMEIEAPRDRVVQAVNQVFRDPVLNWVFSGDLLPSAAGPTGTLHDLMQAAPFRPGVFHGIEKRRRVNTHDEKARATLEALQVALGRKDPEDKVVTGELYLLEGNRLTLTDLEWISRNRLTDEKLESWTLVSEEELRKNSRFQTEQVAKYLLPTTSTIANRWMQYRHSQKTSHETIDWSALRVALQAGAESGLLNLARTNLMEEEECFYYPRIDFSKAGIERFTKFKTEFALLNSQMEAIARGLDPKIQILQSVLPARDRLWLGADQGYHPERIWDEYFDAVQKAALTTDTALIQSRTYFEDREQSPIFFWTGSLSVLEKSDVSANDSGREVLPNQPIESEMIEWIWIGDEKSEQFSDVLMVQKLMELKELMSRTQALCFSVNTTGKRLGEVFMEVSQWSRLGLDVVVDSHEGWIKSFAIDGSSLSQLWGVRAQNRDFLIAQLKERNLTYIHFGTSSQSGKVRWFHQGQCVLEWAVPSKTLQPLESGLLDDVLYVQDPLKKDHRITAWGAEELLLRKDPWVIRPKSTSWAGLMVLSELWDSSLTFEDFEWVLRKTTALGGQMACIQVSMLNGLKEWAKMIKSLSQDFGIQLNHFHNTVDPSVQAHWCAVQLVSKIPDIRNIRSEDVRSANERLYFLNGQFDQPAFRWLAGLEGRHQNSLIAASAIPNQATLPEHVLRMLVKRKLGAELKVSDQPKSAGFLVSLNESDRFSVEEEWKTIGIEFEFLGRSTNSPYLIVREDSGQVHTLSVEDAAVLGSRS